MTRAIRVVMALVLCLIATLPIISARATPEDVTVVISIFPHSLSAPGQVSVSLQVISQQALEHFRVLYNNNLMISAEYIPALVTTQLTFSQNITADELGRELTYVAYWNDPDGSEQHKELPFMVMQTAPVAPQPTPPGVMGTVVKLTAGCEIDKPIVKPNEEVTITYVLENKGDTTLQNIIVVDTTFGNMGSIDLLQPNERRELVAKKTLTQTVMLDSTIIYTAVGSSATRTEHVTGITITLADPKFEALLKLEKSDVAPGDAVVMTCDIKNSGSIGFDKIAVTLSNGVKLEDIPALAPGESSVIAYSFTAEKTEMLSMSFTATDTEGNTHQFKSNEAPLKVIAQSGEVVLLVNAKANVTRLDAAGEVTLEIVVSNQGSKAVTDLTVTEDQLGLLWEMAVLEPGDKLYRKTVWVEKTTSYIFVVTTKDENGAIVTASSAPLQVVVGSETPMTLDPLATGLPEDEQSTALTKNPAETFFRIMGIIITVVVLIILVLVVLVIQERRIIQKRGRRISAGGVGGAGEKSKNGDGIEVRKVAPSQRRTTQTPAKRPTTRKPR